MLLLAASFLLIITGHTLEICFNRLFLEQFRVVLCGGLAEPEYLPATADAPAVVGYRQDYVRSALHEVAHWCIAGEERRCHRDYGYWYAPDGRDSAQQSVFYRVEVEPQALEWIFSRAAGIGFEPSLDNLELSDTSRRAAIGFCLAIRNKAADLLQRGMNPRAERFCAELLQCGRGSSLTAEQILGSDSW